MRAVHILRRAESFFGTAELKWPILWKLCDTYDFRNQKGRDADIGKHVSLPWML